MEKTKKFQRKIEDFTCGNCGIFVHGNGFTNHCPKCLWSKHVDINPGDRGDSCGGMMKPVDFSVKSGEQAITHACVVCGLTRRNKMAPDDDFEEALRIIGGSFNNLDQ